MSLPVREFRSIEQMRCECDYSLEEVLHVHLANAFPVYFNFEAIEAKLARASIDCSLKDACAVLGRLGGAMSKAQGIARNRLSGEEYIGFRPPRYGRASIFEWTVPSTKETLLCELKGCGVTDKTMLGRGIHDNGLQYLHIALTEVLNAKILDVLFERRGLNVACVPLLGVVNLGFTTPSEEGPSFPVANLIRDSHLRPIDNSEIPKSGSPEEFVKSAIQEELERHGFTSTGYTTAVSVALEDKEFRLRHGGRLTEISQENIRRLSDYLKIELPFTIFPTNIQLAKEVSRDPLFARLVDLSHYKAFVASSGYVCTFVSDRPANIGTVRPIMAERKIIPDLPLLNHTLLKGRSLLEDPRFSKIVSAFPNWEHPELHYSGAMIEALFISACIHTGEMDNRMVSNHLSDFVVRCFKT